MTCVIDPGETAQPIHVDDGPFIGNANSGLRKRPFEAEGKPRKSIVLQTVMDSEVSFVLYGLCMVHQIIWRDLQRFFKDSQQIVEILHRL